MSERLNRESEGAGFGENEWARMAEDAPKFAGDIATETKSTTAEREKSPEYRSIKIMQELLAKSEIDPAAEFPKLEEFAKARGEALGIKSQINIFLRREFWEDHQRKNIRYNPTKDEVYGGGHWKMDVRAFHAPKGSSHAEGTFIDFPFLPSSEGAKLADEQVKKNLTGYEAMDALVDFAFTCEHELQHDLQFQRMETGEVSYPALKVIKDNILTSTLHFYKNDEAKYFYTNAHDDLYIEMDANDAARALMDEMIPVGGTLANKIANPQDRVEYQKSLWQIAQRRGEIHLEENKQHKLTLGENTLGIPKKTYEGTAEEIVEEYCDDLIKRYPDYVKVYPALALEYNSDGSVRTRENIEALLREANEKGGVTLGGKEIPAKKLQQYYHKLLKSAKRYRKDDSGGTARAGAPSGEGEIIKEEMPAGKSEEQIRAERKRAEDEAFRKRMADYNEQQKRLKEQKQREESERILEEKREREAERKRMIQAKREEVLRAMREDASEMEDEDEMGM